MQPPSTKRMQPNPSSSSEESRGNRKLLIWFLVALIVALLPWFVLA